MPDQPQSSRHGSNSELARLVERAGIRQPCDLDLMVFFGRHPRSLLSSDSLAAFLGYDITQIAEALDHLLAAGVLRRRQQTSTHAARLYELLIDPAGTGWFPELLAQASARPGRLALLAELARYSPRSAGENLISPLEASRSSRVVRLQPAAKVTTNG